jgi:hypothetical protein
MKWIPLRNRTNSLSEQKIKLKTFFLNVKVATLERSGLFLQFEKDFEDGFRSILRRWVSFTKEFFEVFLWDTHIRIVVCCSFR